MNIRVLILDLCGDFAHFRKYYSTSSPVSFSIIPPVTVMGVLGAILGLPREENQYLAILNAAGTKVGVRLLQPVKKIRMGINLINTKGNIWVPKQRREGARTPIRFEFLKDVGYRLYINMQDESLFEKLIRMVKQHKCYYTVSLGLSELIADFRFIGEKEFIWRENDDRFVEVLTAVPVTDLLNEGINLVPGQKYIKERVPLQMDKKREVLSYGEILTEVQGKPLNVKLKGYWENAQERIVFV